MNIRVTIALLLATLLLPLTALAEIDRTTTPSFAPSVELSGAASPFSCQECDGGVTELTLRYDGTGSPLVIVRDKNAVYFAGVVNSGGVFTVKGTKSDGKFEKNELEVYVSGTLDEKIHVSCSKPIGAGSVFGSFTVVSGTSRKGGELCPIDGSGNNGGSYDGTDAVCYLVADNDGKNNSADFLSILDASHNEIFVGQTGTDHAEAVAYQPVTGQLFAADGHRFGTLNPSTGTFTEIGEFGSGYGSKGNQQFTDIDGLAFDPFTGALFAAVRRSAEDLLIQVDPATGKAVVDAFGPGKTYLAVAAVWGTSIELDDIDDIAIDPKDGSLFGILNEGGMQSRLVRIDKETGATADVTDLDVENVEGLGFAADGSLLGVLGDDDAKVVVIDQNSGTTSTRTVLGAYNGTDYEAIACLTDATNEILGRVFEDKNANGSYDSYDAGFGGATVILHRDSNGNGTLDSYDVEVGTTISAADGTYGFWVSSLGKFLITVDESTLPNDAVFTTTDLHTAAFTSFGQTDTGNDFGFKIQPAAEVDLSLEKSVNKTNPAIGDHITYTIEVKNASNAWAAATNIEITDLVPDGVLVTSTDPVASVSGAKLSWTIARLEPGQSVWLKIEAKVKRPGTHENCAQIWSADQLDTDSAYGNGFHAYEDDDDCATITVAEPNGRAMCYLVADNDDYNSSADVLTKLDPSNNELVIGATGTTYVESIAFQPSTGKLFAADSGRLGTLDLNTGAFTLVGTFGRGDGALGNIHFGDIDGLAFDPFSGTLFASVRLQGQDLLIKVDPTTGAAIVDGFGSGKTYVPVETIFADGLELDDVDDIAIDSYDGKLYGILNEEGMKSRLVFIDKATGDTQDITDLDIDNVEGLGFAADGTLLGVAGDSDRQVVVIDQATGKTTLRADLGIYNNRDYEAIACLTDDTNLISGTVFLDANKNGKLDYSEAGQGNVTVKLYRDTNGNGKVDIYDAFVASTQSAVDGTYSFIVSSLGDFVIETDLGSYPAGATLTTDNVETASFASFGLTDAGNDFGFFAQASGNKIDLELTKEVDNSSPKIGEEVTFSITVVNAGQHDATGIVVRDVLPYGLEYVSSYVYNGSYDQWDGIWEVGSLKPGRSETLDITVKVTVQNTVENVAQIIAADQEDIDSTPANGVDTEDDQDRALVTARSSGTFTPTDCTDMGTINALVYHEQSDQLFAATETGGIHISNDEGQSWPIFLQTDNRTPIRDIAVSHSGVLYAASFGAGVYVSDNSGDSWNNIGPIGAEFEAIDVDDDKGHLYAAADGGVQFWNGWDWSLAGASSNPFSGKQVRAVVVDETTGIVFASSHGIGVWALINGHWSKKDHGLPSTLINDLFRDRDGNLYAATNADGVYLLNGTKWESFGTGLEGQPIATIDQGADGKLLAGTKERGAWYYDAYKGKWIEAINLPAYTVSAITSAPDGSIYAGTPGQGTFRFIDSNGDGSLDQWRQVSALVANAVIQDIVKTETGELFAATYGYGVLYSSDGGQCWTRMNRGFENLYTYAIERNSDGTLFVGIWADGKGGVWRSDDGARNWQFLGLGNRQVISLAIDPNDEDVMYAGINLEWGSIYRSMDGGWTWDQLNTFGDPAWSIVVDPRDSDHIVVGTIGRGVWDSKDGGQTWAPLGGNGLPSGAFDLAYGPEYGPYAGELFAATPEGVYWYDDWVLWGHGSEQYEIRTLAFMGDMIFAGTWGKGVIAYNPTTDYWEDAGFGDIPVLAFAVYEESKTLVVGTSGAGFYMGQNLSVSSTSTSNAHDFEQETPSAFDLEAAYPNPFNPQTTIPFTVRETAHVRLAVYDLLGREVAMLVDGVVSAGTHRVQFEAGNIPSGTYLVRLSAGIHQASTTISLLK